MDHRSGGKRESRQKNEANKLINDQSEWHCTLSGRFLGNGTAVTYLWGTGLWPFAAPASEDDEVSAPSTWPRPWNLANRLMTDIFSRSWHSILKSTSDAPFSNLDHKKACYHKEMKTLKSENPQKRNYNKWRTRKYVMTAAAAATGTIQPENHNFLFKTLCDYKTTIFWSAWLVWNLSEENFLPPWSSRPTPVEA